MSSFTGLKITSLTLLTELDLYKVIAQETICFDATGSPHMGFHLQAWH